MSNGTNNILVEAGNSVIEAASRITNTNPRTIRLALIIMSSVALLITVLIIGLTITFLVTRRRGKHVINDKRRVGR
ncbi:hypothetical protein GJ496_004332 [Pomphorhynchus laevis]|nr:hypothetical protein GJ496_004332 [Pomphorhynchus laevis]